jgi:WD40 repeat protein
MGTRNVTNEKNEEQKPIQIVGVYAQEDETFYLQLKKSLYLWERQGHLLWREILPGSDRRATLHAFIECSDVILLFLSPDFFPDEYCYQAMQDALQERVSRPVSVIPILVRAVHWRTSPCKHLAIIPQNEKPVASWVSSDEAYQYVCADLVHLIPRWQSIMLSFPVRPPVFQARDLPKSYVPRPKAFEAIKHLLLTRQAMAITTALRGAGGFGKTTLALALCHDSEIQAAFPDGILWVELGEHPPRPLDILNSVLASLEPSLSGAITWDEVRDRWRKALDAHRYLLVIDDVWQSAALSPLLEGGPQCIRLITTRNDQVLPDEAVRVWVDAMEPEEAIAVLCRGLPEEIQQEVYQPTLSALAARLGCWPLLLTLAHGLLVDQIRYGRRIASALEVVERAYQRYGIVAFDLGQANERHQTVKRCLDVSMHHLEEFTLAHSQATTRYQELAVFPEDTDIPLTTLHHFWQGSGGLETWETDELCVRLHRLSLLLTCDLSKGTIRLHDVMRSYLIQIASSNLPFLHEGFLDASKLMLGLKRWADLPLDEYYLWQYLVLHLCEAKRTEELHATITDLTYLIRKALHRGVPALEADLLRGCTFQKATSAQLPFESLHRTIARLSHLLRQVHTSAEIGGLLLSHLGSQQPFAAQRPVLEYELPRPFLTAWHPLPSRTSSGLLRTLYGHIGYVDGCAVNPDRSFIVSASRDKTLKVWDAITGAERLSLCGHSGYVHDCAVSPDGSFIVSASHDRTLKVWDAVTGVERLSFTGHTDCIGGCAVSPDGSFIVSASNDHTLKMWDTVTGAERLSLCGHSGYVHDCAVSPDGSFIVSASHDHTLKVWDVVTGTERLSLTGHTDCVGGCAVSPDGSFIVSASNDHTLKVWDTSTGVERLSLTGHNYGVNSCAVSPDGSFIVSASDDQTLKIWNAVTGTERLSFSGHTSRVTSCVVSYGGNWIVSASDDLTLKVWDTAAGVEHLSLTGHTDWVRGCAVSPDGSWIVSASDDHTLKVWDTSTGVERLSLSGHTDWVRGCAVSPDGSFIVSASCDKTLKVWDASTGAEHLSLTGHSERVNYCAVSPDGSFIISASHDHTLKAWDAVTGAERLSFTGHTHEVYGCAVSPDGSWIVSASDDHTLKVWDAVTGTERLSLSGHTNWVNGCAVSPDGNFIVSASEDETLKVWDVVTGAEHLSLTGHTGGVNGCAVSPDGNFIVSVSDDHTLKVWNTRTGHCRLTFPVDGSLYGCAFHPDGEHLVACGAQGMFFLRLVV